jgi:phage gpG-like protein
MSGIELKGNAKGFGEVQSKLASMVKRGGDPRPWLAFAGYWMVYNAEGVKHEFDTKGEGSWAAGPKLRRGELLRDTRTLERSISYRVVGKTNVAIGTNDFVGFVQQNGMTIRAKTRKGLRFIAADMGFSGPIRKGASIRRNPKRNPKTGKWPKLAEGNRWYRLMQVVIPPRPVLRWRRKQQEMMASKYGEWVATGGGISSHPFNAGNPNPTRKGGDKR